MLINGIMTDLKLHANDMQALANTGVNVVGIRNATRGMVMDLWQCIKDKLNLGTNPSVTTAANTIYDTLQAKGSLHLIGHSHGALILSRALLDVRNRLILEDGLTPQQAEETLSRVKIETYGGSANRFIDGPQYTHYVNKYDAVPMLTGVGMDWLNPFGRVGKGAVMKVFNEVGVVQNMPGIRPEGLTIMRGLSNFFARFVDRTTHGVQDLYFKKRE